MKSLLNHKLLQFYGQDFLCRVQVIVSQFQNEVYIYAQQ